MSKIPLKFTLTWVVFVTLMLTLRPHLISLKIDIVVEVVLAVYVEQTLVFGISQRHVIRSRISSATDAHVGSSIPGRVLH